MCFLIVWSQCQISLVFRVLRTKVIYNWHVYFKISIFLFLCITSFGLFGRTYHQKNWYQLENSYLNKWIASSISVNVRFGWEWPKTQQSSDSNKIEVFRFPEPDVLLGLNSFPIQKYGVGSPKSSMLTPWSLEHRLLLPVAFHPQYTASTSWSKMAEPAPAIVSTFQPTRNKGKKKGILF